MLDGARSRYCCLGLFAFLLPMIPSRTLVLALLLAACLAPGLHAQTPDSVYTRPDQPPTLLPDAQTALSFLQLTIAQPDSIYAPWDAGTLYVEVVVDTSGAVASSRIVRSLWPDRDSAAVRAVQMLRFAPARHGGATVRASAMVPVAFDPMLVRPDAFDPQAYPTPDSSAQMLPDPQSGMHVFMDRISRGDAGQRLIAAHAGRVVVGFRVDAAGSVGEIDVIRGLSPVADSVVVEAVQSTLTFAPARLDAAPIASYRILPVDFRDDQPPLTPSAPGIYADDGSEVDAKPLMLPDLRTAMRKMQEGIVYPERLKRAGISGEVIAEFVVDEQGHVIHPRVIQRAHPLFDEQVMIGVRGLRFAPAVRNGRPVKFRMTIPMRFYTKMPMGSFKR